MQVIAHDSYELPIKITAWDDKALTLEGRLAMDLAARWAMIACEPDGEDSSGRQKARRMTTEEVVKFAVETAQKSMAVFEEKGWVKHFPQYEKLLADKKAFEEKAEKEPSQKGENRKRWLGMF